jgi:hypothetical protein
MVHDRGMAEVVIRYYSKGSCCAGLAESTVLSEENNRLRPAVADVLLCNTDYLRAHSIPRKQQKCRRGKGKDVGLTCLLPQRTVRDQTCILCTDCRCFDQLGLSPSPVFLHRHVHVLKFEPQ